MLQNFINFYKNSKQTRKREGLFNCKVIKQIEMYIVGDKIIIIIIIARLEIEMYNNELF